MLNQRRLVYPTKMNNQNNIRLNQDNIPAGINKDSGDNPSEILQHLQRNSNILRDRYFWYVVILAILMGIFCYAPKLAILAGVAPLPDWEYAFFVAGYRTFYILCVTVAAWRLGILNGIITSVVLALVLFSPLLFTPPAAFNTWLELGVVGFSIIVSFVIGRQGKMQKLLTKTAYELQQQAMQLRLEVNERKKAERDLRTLSLRAMESLVFALEAKDKYTAGHSRRVTDITMCIGNKMCLSKEDLEDLRCGSLLHDVGKIGVDQLIQNKPDNLTPVEYEQIMQHVQSGVGIVRPVVKEKVVQMIEHHHDHYDGSGHNQYLVGEDIPLGARIIAVADAYDAMTSDRPYRPAMTRKEAMEEIRRCTGTQFDPIVAAKFLNIPPDDINRVS